MDDSISDANVAREEAAEAVDGDTRDGILIVFAIKDVSLQEQVMSCGTLSSVA